MDIQEFKVKRLPKAFSCALLGISIQNADDITVVNSYHYQNLWGK